MNAGQYIGRALRYFLKLAILVAAIYALLFVTGYAKVSAEYFVTELFHSRQGLVLLIMLLLLAAAYPAFGYVRRSVGASITINKEEIITAFQNAGYSLADMEEGSKIVFRASSIFRRIWMVFDDKVTVTADGSDSIIIEGIRKEVVQAQFRIETYMRNKSRDE